MTQLLSDKDEAAVASNCPICGNLSLFKVKEEREGHWLDKSARVMAEFCRCATCKETVFTPSQASVFTRAVRKAIEEKNKQSVYTMNTAGKILKVHVDDAYDKAMGVANEEAVRCRRIAEAATKPKENQIWRAKAVTAEDIAQRIYHLKSQV